MEFSFQAQDHNALAISIVRFLVTLPHPGLVTLRQTFVRRSQNCVGAAGGRCTSGFRPSSCPLWGISDPAIRQQGSRHGCFAPKPGKEADIALTPPFAKNRP